MTDLATPSGARPPHDQTDADDGFPMPLTRPQPGVARQVVLHWLAFLGGTAALLGAAAWLF